MTLEPRAHSTYAQMSEDLDGPYIQMYVAIVAEHLDQLQELIDTLADATGCPATLEDRDLNLVVSSGHEDVIDEVRRASILRRRSGAEVQEVFAAFGIARSEQPLRIPGDPASERLSRWCIPVRWRQVTYGYFWLLDPAEGVSHKRLDDLGDVVDQAAAVMALRSRAAERINWAGGELMSDDAGARARALDELRSHGVLPQTGTVLVVALAPRHGGALGPVNSWLLPRTVIAAPVGRRAALVVPNAVSSAAASVASRVAQSLLAQHPGGVAAGISGLVEPGDAHMGWRQAGASLSVALHQLESATGADAGVAVWDWADLGVRRLLALADPSALTMTLVGDRLRGLHEADGDLLRTVHTYLDHAAAATQSANALAIHRQTLYQRLRRVEELTGFDLSDGHDRLLMHLALVLGDVGADDAAR
jgi:hypothetical protein